MRTIDAQLAKELIAAQYPQWAKLPVYPVEKSGHDNRTFHLGDALTVRLPSGEGYANQIHKEWRWMPHLAPQLPLPIPVPVALGRPDCGYPWHWTVCPWLGETASEEGIVDYSRFARDLASFLQALRGIDCTDGPLAGAHNFYRGGDLAVYDEEARNAIADTHRPLGIGADTLTALWERALATKWSLPPVWVHGDVAIGNLLVKDGRLSAVIDFGTSGTGDPACDLVMAWTLFDGESRDAFVKAVDLPADVWERAMGWALWKALITYKAEIDRAPLKAAEAARVVARIAADERFAR
ncbi:aminoglycoside phosphotransferase family protein [Ruminococcaceae bacterium OttesenSCG-928-L11]|nr:aminoglycoside phosphotransferase family protein [Ruminococcaceae bacterium OttesenSCG-928-L11]